MRYYALLAVMHAANVDGVGDLRRYRRRGAWHRRERASNATAQDASRRGVILWAHGRSATDTFCEAMRQAAHLTYCRNIKEGFNHLHAEGKRLTRNRLKNCVRRGQLPAPARKPRRLELDRISSMASRALPIIHRSIIPAGSRTSNPATSIRKVWRRPRRCSGPRGR